MVKYYISILFSCIGIYTDRMERVGKRYIDKLQKSDLDWYPDDLMSSDVCIYGTEKDVRKALKIIGRQ